MYKKLLLVMSLLFIALITNASDGPKIESKVQKVIVFLNSAQVTRTATVNVPAGTSTLVFTNISSAIDVQSIQVSARGEFTIMSVKNETDFLNEQTKEKALESLQTQQKAINDKIAFQNNLLNIYQQEENMLVKNQVVTGNNANLDLLKLKQALDFQTQRLTEIKKKQQDVNDQIALLRVEQQKYNKQIADFNRGNNKTTSNILVTVSAKAPVQTEFTLNYVVNNANWYPTYDVRAKNVNSPITIAYKANVSQQSGEDWKNIKLTLSTGNPTVSGSKPQLNPYYLNFGMYNVGPASSITKVTGRVSDNKDGSALVGLTVKVKGTSIATTTDASGNYSIQLPTGNQMLQYNYVGYEQVERAVNYSVINVGLTPVQNSLDEVVVVGYGQQPRAALAGAVAGITTQKRANLAADIIPIMVQQTETQTNVEFNIDNPYSIPSDGKQYLVEINQVELPATYQYYVAPKLSTDVFLTAQLTDWNKYNFQSGEANLFFEGTFIGKSLIDTRTTTDTLNLSLGTDKNIVVTRTQPSGLTEKQALSSNKKETKNWLIEVKNRKTQSINLLVEDQIPVSQNSAIEVDVQELSGGKLDKETGKVSWSLNLKEREEKKLQLKYQVRYPKNQSVIVQ